METIVKNVGRRGCWRLIGRIMLAVSLALALVILCAIIFGPQLETVVTGTAFGPTWPQSPLTPLYARAQVDSVHVTRTEDPATVLPPLDKTVTSVASAQTLYNVAFALPPYPTGTINCPLGADITYHLAFANHRIPVLTITANGCERVSLVGLGDRLANGEFWQALSSALGVSESAMWSEHYR